MAETGTKTEIVPKDEHNHPNNPFFSLFQNLQHLFPQVKRETVADVVVAEESTRTVHEERESSTQKSDTVKFADSRPIVPPPLKLEAEVSEQNSSPTVLWQVYALGGFMILRWVWARWNERRPKNESSDEESPPADDD